MRYQSATDLLVDLQLFLQPSTERISEDVCPYRGLAAFGEGDAKYFFGRSAEIRTALAQLESWPLLAVIGPSGVGKSSFVHAGLTGHVAQGVLAQLRRDLYGRLLTLPPRWFEQRHSGELLSRFTADVAQLEFSAAQALASVSRDTLQVLALLVVCFLTDWRLFLVTFIVLPVIFGTTIGASNEPTPPPVFSRTTTLAINRPGGSETPD